MVVISQVLGATPRFAKPVVPVGVRSLQFLFFLLSSHVDGTERHVVGCGGVVWFACAWFSVCLFFTGEMGFGFGLGLFQKKAEIEPLHTADFDG